MGKLIVIEGIDGSGKATQTKLLEAHLTAAGTPPLRISFPNYKSESSGPLRLYLDGKISERADDINPYAASSFYSVDRYISYKQSWEQDYLAGRLILSDRFTTSNITHQTEKEPRERWDSFIDWLCDFEYGKLGLPRPNLVLYLDMHPEVSEKLMDKRYQGDDNKKDIHERDRAYLLRCRECALYAAKRLDWKVVPCYREADMTPRTIDEIAAEVAAAADQFLKNA